MRLRDSFSALSSVQCGILHEQSKCCVYIKADSLVAEQGPFLMRITDNVHFLVSLYKESIIHVSEVHRRLKYLHEICFYIGSRPECAGALPWDHWPELF